MITISRESARELTDGIEDMIEYWCRECAANGELVSGETAWKIVNAYSAAKEWEMSTDS